MQADPKHRVSVIFVTAIASAPRWLATSQYKSLSLQRKLQRFTAFDLQDITWCTIR